LDILILNLVAFSQTGGVEKVSRILAKAGCDIAKESGQSIINLSLYDDKADSRYCPEEFYKGFNQNKIKFVIEAIIKGRTSKHLVLTHINLALPALLIKLVNPRVKIHLIAHGIEVWNPLTRLQKALLQSCSQILSVSNYTKNRILSQLRLKENKIKILNNCLDPFYKAVTTFDKPVYLQERYGIKENDQVLLTLCRLSSSEKYKGYDKVIEAIAGIEEKQYLKYLLLGKYDSLEYKRINDIISKHNLQNNIILAGFVKDEELTDHLLLGDLFIMPSIKEGFGIVFIEAAAAGLAVISGNKDGSVDAMLNGELGSMVEPSDLASIANAIQKTLKSPPDPEKQQLLALSNFSYEVYKNNLKQHLN